MQQPPALPQQINVTELHGVNERSSPANLRPGEFSYLEGLYPSQNGLLSRIPGKVLLATTAGNAGLLSGCQTFNRNGDIVFQTTSGIIAYTLDELRNRQTVPNLTPGTSPGSNVEEEGMSIAIMYQEEANGVAGGTIDGWISGSSPNTALVNTFYGRRLNKNPVNQSSTIVSFTASTGGGGAFSTPGTFTLAPATYRVKAWFTFGVTGADNAVVELGLWNNTTSGFQLDDGTGSTTAQPIKASQAFSSGVSGLNLNVNCFLQGRFTVTSSNNDFYFKQAMNLQVSARLLACCGFASGMNNSGVFMAGAAPLQRYALVEILKEP